MTEYRFSVVLGESTDEMTAEQHDKLWDIGLVCVLDGTTLTSVDFTEQAENFESIVTQKVREIEKLGIRVVHVEFNPRMLGEYKSGVK